MVCICFNWPVIVSEYVFRWISQPPSDLRYWINLKTNSWICVFYIREILKWSCIIRFSIEDWMKIWHFQTPRQTNKMVPTLSYIFLIEIAHWLTAAWDFHFIFNFIHKAWLVAGISIDWWACDILRWVLQSGGVNHFTHLYSQQEDRRPSHSGQTGLMPNNQQVTQFHQLHSPCSRYSQPRCAICIIFQIWFCHRTNFSSLQ